MAEILNSKNFPADSILCAIHDHRLENTDFSELVKTWCVAEDYKWHEKLVQDKTVEGAQEFTKSGLTQLSAMMGESESYDEFLRFAVVCGIETSAASISDVVRFCLFDMGEPDHAAAQLQLLMLSTYLSTSKTASQAYRIFGEARMLLTFSNNGYDDPVKQKANNISRAADWTSSEIIRPLLPPEQPSSHTKQTYRGKIDHVLAELHRRIRSIEYLGQAAQRQFIDGCDAALEGALRGTLPRAGEGYHSILPLREFSIDMNENPQSKGLGTAATFTFGVLLK